VGEDYLRELGVAPTLPDAPAERFDAVRQYGSDRWLRWCEARLRAPAATWTR
jgi:hypothetical protein